MTRIRKIIHRCLLFLWIDLAETNSRMWIPNFCLVYSACVCRVYMSFLIYTYLLRTYNILSWSWWWFAVGARTHLLIIRCLFSSHVLLVGLIRCCVLLVLRVSKLNSRFGNRGFRQIRLTVKPCPNKCCTLVPPHSKQPAWTVKVMYSNTVEDKKGSNHSYAYGYRHCRRISAKNKAPVRDPAASPSRKFCSQHRRRFSRQCLTQVAIFSHENHIVLCSRDRVKPHLLSRW